MRPIRVVWVKAGATLSSNPIPLDHRKKPFSVGVNLTATTGASATIQYTLDDIYTVASPHWVSSTFTATGTRAGILPLPCTAVRLNTSSTGAYSVTLRIVQAG